MLPTSRNAILSLLLALTVLMGACATAPYTGRRQLLMTSEGSETNMGYQAFHQIKQKYKVSQDPAINAEVKKVGERIAAAAKRPDFRWEFVVFDEKEANAFCLPGGKVGIFTGILKYTKDEAGLATVISHEVAHALARHAGERMSQGMLAQMGGIGLSAALGGVGSTAGQAIMTGYSLGTQFGILLPYSRTQEYEADRIGLILMAKAGYDPAQALEFWKRMSAKDKGAKPPQFMSTHPSDANRLREIQAFLPEARRYYLPAQSAETSPSPRAVPPPSAKSSTAVKSAPVSGRWLPESR
ncbi:MAG: M48 family metallopeptidase [Thermodesulfobacteriota bacterium]